MMGWPKCNNTLETETIHEVVVLHGLTLHQIGLIAAFAGSVISIIASIILIVLHALNYRKPYEQKHIIRILIMVPIFSTVSFLSYLFYRHSVYFEVLRDLYGAIAIAAFFTLMCHYVANGLHEQKIYFRQVEPKGWVWPLSMFKKCCGGERGIWRTPRSGLTWFNIVWLGVFQYAFIRVIFTCVAAATQAVNLYCQESLSPAFAHIWVICIEAVSVLIAMYCIIQFYWQVKEDIGQHSPILKVVAIKLVIFLSFWQTILISFLTSAGVITSGPRLNQADIKIGIPSVLLCWEMAIFAIFHFWAFSVGPYRRGADPMMTENKGGFLGVKAIIGALNFWDLFQAVGRSIKWLFIGRKHRMEDTSYNKTGVPANDTAIDLERITAYDEAEEDSTKPGAKEPSIPTIDDDEELLKHVQPAPISDPRFRQTQPGNGSISGQQRYPPEPPSYREEEGYNSQWGQPAEYRNSPPRNQSPYAEQQGRYHPAQHQGQSVRGDLNPYDDERRQYSQDRYQTRNGQREPSPYDYDQGQYDARQGRDERYSGAHG